MLKFVSKAVWEDNPHYDPERLLNTLHSVLGVPNDAQLARRLLAEPAQICKIRKRRVPVASALLISMHEESKLSLRTLRALMGDYRPHTGPSAKHPVEPPLDHLAAAVLQAPRRSLVSPERMS